MAQTWNPLQDLMVLQDRMNRLFEDATQRRAQSEADITDEVESADWYPAADITENDGQFVVTVDLPGVDRAALDINIDDSKLMIRGTRNIETTSQQRAERPRGRFIRSFGVPSSVDQGKIRAEYRDGVLDVILPKRTEHKAKRVEIKVS